MPTDDNDKLSRREREIMDLAYELSGVTVRDLTDRLREPPTDGAVRTMLARLEGKGLLRKVNRAGRATWAPTASRGRAQRTALRRLVRTFFDGSIEQAVSALLANRGDLDNEELDRLAQLIEEHRRRTR
ncbi:MAG: BlaI/MecI/CopY family transcriptional regulator [Planctomycetes bacterium]|nr:BlaI/MecI/CopY family transcriptional regulator [Planctomycetota bacterium]